MKEDNKIKFNKKMSKKTIIIVSILVLIIVSIILFYMFFNSNSKTSKSLISSIESNDYYIKLIVLDKELKATDEVIELNRDNNNVAIIKKDYSQILYDNTYYYVINSQKLAMKSKVTKQNSAIKLSEPELKESNLSSTTTEKLGNKEYVCQTYKNSKLYLDSGNIKYLDMGGTIYEVLDFSNSCKKELFSIPEGYTISEENSK